MTRQEKDMRAPFNVPGCRFDIAGPEGEVDWDEYEDWDESMDDEYNLDSEMDEILDQLDADEEYYLDEH